MNAAIFVLLFYGSLMVAIVIVAGLFLSIAGYAPLRARDFAPSVNRLLRRKLVDVEHIAALERRKGYRVLRTQFRALDRRDPAAYQRIVQFLEPRRTGVAAVLKYLFASPDKRPSSASVCAAIPCSPTAGVGALQFEVTRMLSAERQVQRTTLRAVASWPLARAHRVPPLVPEQHPLQRHIIMYGRQGLDEIIAAPGGKQQLTWEGLEWPDAYLLEEPLGLTIAGCKLRLVAMEPWLANENQEVVVTATWFYPKETLTIRTKERVEISTLFGTAEGFKISQVGALRGPF